MNRSSTSPNVAASGGSGKKTVQSAGQPAKGSLKHAPGSPKSSANTKSSRQPSKKSEGALTASAKSSLSRLDLIKMGETKVQSLIDTDPDFVAVPRYGCSLDTLCKAHPEGASDRLVAQALSISEEQAHTLYLSVVAKLRTFFKL